MGFDVFIVDVDGCLSSGRFLYDETGKRYKEFGPDDALALQKLSVHLPVVIVSGDTRAEAISRRRVEDMGFQLTMVPSEGRLEWIKERYDLSRVIYMGDSFTDLQVVRNVGFSMCPQDANTILRNQVNYICRCSAAHRAVAEAVFHIWILLGLPHEELYR